jgi:HSP20 family protein
MSIANDPLPSGPLQTSVERLRHEFDRWLEAAMSQGERALDAIRPRGSDRGWMPFIDLLETPNEVLVLADLPGVDPKSVDITLTGNMLTLRGEKSSLGAEEGRVLHVRERTRGPFQRSIPMPAPVNPDDVTAEADHGVLRIRLAKADRAKARQIQVTTAPSVSPPVVL